MSSRRMRVETEQFSVSRYGWRRKGRALRRLGTAQGVRLPARRRAPVRNQGSDGVAEADPSLPVINLHIGMMISRACEDRTRVGRGGERASRKGSRSRPEDCRCPGSVGGGGGGSAERRRVTPARGGGVRVVRGGKEDKEGSRVGVGGFLVGRSGICPRHVLWGTHGMGLLVLCART